MSYPTKHLVAIVILLGLLYPTLGSMDESDRNTVEANFPYGRGLDNELQLARLLMTSQRMCHPKRNSELINSLLGLPKNMNNAGK